MIASADPTRCTGRTCKIIRYSERRCKHPPSEIADCHKWNEQAAASAGRRRRCCGYRTEYRDREHG
jgi:hypothetical protein